ncbi:MAG: GIY-YIG nuclease family protein [Gemmatimonadaceae bacterium]|nr:GIY-YIG nuclease family protein [Chitinophagaceae bacterium]
MDRPAWVYIMANKRRTTLYIGVTINLELRVLQHKTKFFPDSFTAKYNLDCLVWFEEFPSLFQAVEREKEIKKWRRSKKENLIRSVNPDWRDLSI